MADEWDETGRDFAQFPSANRAALGESVALALRAAYARGKRDGLGQAAKIADSPVAALADVSVGEAIRMALEEKGNG